MRPLLRPRPSQPGSGARVGVPEGHVGASRPFVPHGVGPVHPVSQGRVTGRPRTQRQVGVTPHCSTGGVSEFAAFVESSPKSKDKPSWLWIETDVQRGQVTVHVTETRSHLGG